MPLKLFEESQLQQTEAAIEFTQLCSSLSSLNSSVKGNPSEKQT